MMRALLGTLVGRVTLLAIAAKAAVFAAGMRDSLSAMLVLLDNIASVALLLVAAYLIVQGVAVANRRLLWRVRRKLIISYIFIGVVPAILIVAFFLLGGLLLFSNFSSYLVQSRLRTLKDHAQSLAQMTALDIQRLRGAAVSGAVARRQADSEGEFPGTSIIVLRSTDPCHTGAGSSSGAAAGAPVATAGMWAHVVPPTEVPGWITCDGFNGILASAPATTVPRAVPSARRGPELDWSDGLALNTFGQRVQIIMRAVAFSEASGDAYVVVVDIPLASALMQRLQQDTGVTLTEVRSGDSGLRPVPARADTPVAVPVPATTLPLTSVAFFDGTDWSTGHRAPLRAAILMNIAAIYDRIAAAQGEVGRYSFGQGLLLVLVIIGVLFLVIEALALAAGLALARSITGSVHELFIGTGRVRAGDFTHKIGIRAKDQLGELASSFNDMTDSIETLLREQDEKKRLEEELRIAHDIQMSLLPQGPLGMPGLSVTALSVPAREVGGDYYDYLPIDEHRVGVLIADVSGKGTSAALYMAELKGLVLSLSRIHTSPRDLLINANRIIAPHLDARSFITMTYAVFDLQARTVTYARAGHTPLMYLSARAGLDAGVKVLAPDGMVVGLKIDDGSMFERLLEEQTMPLHSGDLFVLFTDGISEAMDAADDCFGELRLGRLVEQHAQLPSSELRERILRDIAAFVDGAPQHDDMTIILVRVDDIISQAQSAPSISRDEVGSQAPPPTLVRF